MDILVKIIKGELFIYLCVYLFICLFNIILFYFKKKTYKYY